MNFSNPIRSSANAQPNVVPPQLIDPIRSGGLQDMKAGLVSALSKAEANGFQFYWSRGYQSLLPILPPGVELWPNCQAAKKLELGLDSRGKSPGVLRDGRWTGLREWQTQTTTEEDLISWAAMKASVGLRLDGLVAIDIDATDEQTANLAEQTALKHFGASPLRVGLWPKRVLLYALDGELSSQAVVFTGPGGKNEKIEILCSPKQIVIDGIHQKTGRPYEWRRPLPPKAELTKVAPEQIAAFMNEMVGVLPAAAKAAGSSSIDRAKVDQEGLKGDPELVRKAVMALPNTPELFPTYDDMVRVGQAIHAATIDDPDLGEELWHEWYGKWPDYTPKMADQYWRTFYAPHSVGAGFLYAKAAKHSGGAFTWADVHHDPTAFEGQDEEEVTARKPLLKASPYRFPDPTKIPRREWLYGQHYIREFLSVTVAPGGLGKSSLIIAEALAMASGKPLLGVQPQGQFRVWLLNGEDPLVELERRVAAVMLYYGLTPEDVGDMLFLNSGRDTELVIAKHEREGTVIAAPVVGAVINEIRANRIDVFQVDPFVSSHRVKENDNDAIDMVAKQWGAIAGETKCSIELVHHVRKTNGAEVTPEDGRGAGALVAAARSARTLNRMTKDEAAKLGLEDRYKRLLRFGDAKANLTPPPMSDRTEWMQLVSQPLGNDEGGAVEAEITGDNIGVVARFDMPNTAAAYDGAATDKAFEAIAGGEWRSDVRAGEAWIGVPIAHAFGLDTETDRAKLKSIVAQWLNEGRLKEVLRKDSARKQRRFIEVASRGIFE